MAKDYITILNRLPIRINQYFIRINRTLAGWNINYVNYNDNNRPLFSCEYYNTIEIAIKTVIKQVSEYIDIHDLLQP